MLYSPIKLEDASCPSCLPHDQHFHQGPFHLPKDHLVQDVFLLIFLDILHIRGPGQHLSYYYPTHCDLTSLRQLFLEHCRSMYCKWKGYLAQIETSLNLLCAPRSLLPSEFQEDVCFRKCSILKHQLKVGVN